MAPHSTRFAAVASDYDFLRSYIPLLIMINAALILTLILSIIACCDCCMEDDREYSTKSKSKKSRRKYRHGDRPNSLPGGMVGRKEYGTLALIDTKMQASFGGVAAKAPPKPTGHYIDVGALPPPITPKTDKVATTNTEGAKATPASKEKFVKAGAYGTMMGVENVMKASKGKT